MPSTPLFAVNDCGRVFTLQTNETIWKELVYLGVDFKRVSAHDTVVWALGGDHQIYVYVYGTSVPIRVGEEVYENQRWNPLSNFSSKLLPTDRPVFSSVDGLQSRQFSEVRLPTLAWHWEDEWHLQDTFQGRALDKEAWTYAVDFPNTYTVEKKWNSCVRRRKWIRYRRYTALDTWSSVPALHDDQTEDPFIDICVGGGNIPGQDSDYLMVWGVTVSSKVVVREGVCGTCPEGVKWSYVDTPFDQEITSLSIGRSGRVWAITWKGELLVRNGISRNNPSGLNWLRVDSPDNLGVHCVTVGDESVWVICRDHSIWFRKRLETDCTSHVGSGWLKLSGLFSMASMGPENQIWAIEYETKSLLFRTGVTSSQLGGMEWKEIMLPVVSSDCDSISTTSDMASTSEAISESEGSSNGNWSKDFFCFHFLSELGVNNEAMVVKRLIDSETGVVEEKEEEAIICEAADDRDDTKESMHSSTVSDTVVDYFGSEYLEQVQKEAFHPPWECDETVADNRPTNLVKNQLSGSSSTVNSDIVFPGTLCNLGQEEPILNRLPLEENSWIWISGGGCWIPENISVKWFSVGVATVTSEEWKEQTYQKLIERNKKEKLAFADYYEPYESTSWNIEGECRLLVSGQWAPAKLALEMVSPKFTNEDASLLITYTLHKRKELKVCCGRIVLLQVNCDLPSKCLLSIYCLSLPLCAVVLAFPSESYANSWLGHLSEPCLHRRGYKSLPDSSRCIWAVTGSSDIYVHEVDSSETEIHAEMISSQYELDIGRGKTPCIQSLVRGFRPGCFVVVKVEIKENTKRFHVNLSACDSSSPKIILHINPRLNNNVVVYNSKENDCWGTEATEHLTSDDSKLWEISVLCDDNDIKISINDKISHRFIHRLSPSLINQIEVNGDVNVKSIEYNCGACDRSPSEFFWRRINGHLKRVETGALGIVWGLSHDCRVYIYTGKKSKTVESANSNILMNDVRHFYTYENQRWNPISGFTSRLLATDRSAWSDETGKIMLPKLNYRLPSHRWQWLGDWTVDYNTPGGVDKDGWQFATDFPMKYHGYMYVTDLVRRRRWRRRARITSYGPWTQMEKVALISLSISTDQAVDGSVPVWGITATNEVVYRMGVTCDCAEGTRWALIPSESPLVTICAAESACWSVSVDGRAHVRIGISKENPKGISWANVDAPNVALKHVAATGCHVWAVDQEGGLHHREGVIPLFPEGTNWVQVCGDVSSVSVDGNGVPWAILTHYTKDKKNHYGILARRSGITIDNPEGSGWDLSSGSGWSSVCGRMK